MSDGQSRLVRIIIDPEKAASGEYVIGGVRIVEAAKSFAWSSIAVALYAKESRDGEV